MTSPATVCSPSENVGKTRILANCASKCKDDFNGFAFGRIGSHECDGEKCTCRCVDLATCKRTSDISFNLYGIGPPRAGRHVHIVVCVV